MKTHGTITTGSYNYQTLRKLVSAYAVFLAFLYFKHEMLQEILTCFISFGITCMLHQHHNLRFKQELPLFSWFHFCKNKTFRNQWHSFCQAGCPCCLSTSSVKVPNKTKRTDSNQGFLPISSSMTRWSTAPFMLFVQCQWSACHINMMVCCDLQ